MTAETVARLGNLPAEPNSFVGRERDLGDLRLLLSNVRALTLCGPGGIGKTRLATRLGWQLADEFPDGVWIVEFADSADPALAARQVANVLGIGEEPDRPPPPRSRTRCAAGSCCSSSTRASTSSTRSLTSSET